MRGRDGNCNPTPCVSPRSDPALRAARRGSTLEPLQQLVAVVDPAPATAALLQQQAIPQPRLPRVPLVLVPLAGIGAGCEQVLEPQPLLARLQLRRQEAVRLQYYSRRAQLRRHE